MPPTAQDESRQISRLMLFFALVYVVEGIGQTGGLIAQPLNYLSEADLSGGRRSRSPPI